MVSSSGEQAIKAAYYPSWAQDFDVSSIRTELFTHIYYAFVTLNSSTFKFDIDDDDQIQAPLLEHFTSTLHAKTPPVKALFSVGGASEGTLLFSRMVSSSWSRTAFIHSTIRLARKFGFDGVDLDWDSPENPMEMQNLGYLLEEWRAEVEEEAGATGRAPLLLTAAVYYSADTFAYGPERAYPAASIRKNLDWVNVMSYDYRGAWDVSATGAHAALFDPNTNISTSSGLQSWIRVGVPPSKLIVGLPLYGRTWQLRNPRLHGVGAPAVGVGPGGDIGVLTYAEVVKFNREKKAMIVCDENTVSVYSVAGNDWVGYDDEWSVRKKIEYARNLGLGGYFLWQVTGDYQWNISKTGKLRSRGLSEIKAFICQDYAKDKSISLVFFMARLLLYIKFCNFIIS